MFYQIKSWNFQHLFEKEFRETSQNFNSFSLFRQLLFSSFFISCLIELKFCKVSRNSISNWTWKFQLSILKNKKVLFLKKIFFWPLSISKQKSFVYWPNFQWRFWRHSPAGRGPLGQNFVTSLFLKNANAANHIR